jgi:hypothetical protein
MSRARTWLAVLVALPISIVAIGSMAFTFSELLNPCVVWGASNSGSVYRSADRPCKEGKGVGETRMRAGFEMAACSRRDPPGSGAGGLGDDSLARMDRGSRRVFDDFRSIPLGIQLLAAGVVGWRWVLLDGAPDAGLM